MQARRALLLVALAWATGCLDGPSSPSRPEVEGATWSEGNEASFTIQDIPPGSEGLLVEVEPGDASAMLRSEAGGTWALSGDFDPCFAHYLGPKGSVLFGPRGSFVVGSSRLSPLPAVQQGDPFGASLTWTSSQQSDANPGRVPVLVGLNELDYWRRNGGTLNLSISSEEPFRWRVVEPIVFHCTTRVDEMEGGQYTTLPYYNQATELRTPLTIQRSGHAWVIVSSDQNQEATLAGPDGVAWASPRGAGCHVHIEYQMRPGEWQLNVGRLEGQQVSVHFLALDLPSWVTDDIHRATGLREGDAPPEGAACTGKTGKADAPRERQGERLRQALGPSGKAPAGGQTAR